MTVLAPPMRQRPTVEEARGRPLERGRAKWGIWLFIATEAMLFALLFFAYLYLGASRPEWPAHEDPSYTYALVLLGILLASSVVLYLGERAIKRGSTAGLKAGLGGTLALGVVFLAVQTLEYRHHLRELQPTTDAYGSAFYTITSLHLGHLLLGMLMLAFVFARALAGHFDRKRHLAVENAAVYWHFVDVVWICIVALLYLSPHLYD